MTSGGSNRSKDGVPSWDGNATTFQAYEEQVLVWEQGVKYENRYLCGPRLAAELTGAAQRMIVGKSPTWVSFNGGVAVFLDHLRQGLGKPQIPEATEYLNKYFRSSRRRMGEGINEYITRKTETYWRACQALKRVMPRNASNQAEMERWRPPTTSSGGPWGSRRSSWTSDATGDENETDNAESDGTATTTAGSRTSWSQPYGGSWWSGSSWDWSSYYGSWSWKSTSWEPEATKDAVEILPEFVQAWYLLVDAGLTNAERNLIHTAVRGEYTIARVAHELRAQHGDGDGRRREQGGQAYWGEGRDEDATDHEQDEEDVKDFDTSIFDEEEAALWNENQEEIESAHAVLREAKRTLRSAREKQHQVKMSRKYFRPSGGSHDGPPRDDSKMTCLRCGKEMAPFVCYVEGLEEAMTVGPPSGPTTQEAVANGCCVIDGGATRTLGSVRAVEMVLKKNMTKHGTDRVHHVDVNDKPTFGFGNSSEGQCISTLHLGITADEKPGSLVIHALDEGEGPILFSIDALRKLDAIVDFKQDLVVFRALDPSKIIPLQRSQTGHQLMDLTADIFAAARQAERPVPSLSALTPDSSLPAMMKMTKPQLVKAIQDRGEDPPQQWSRVELRDRLVELMEEAGEEVGGTRKTDLRQWISDLNKNSRKKDNLKEFCETRLKMTLTGNETIPVVQRSALKVIYNISVPNSQDPVGFGKWASLTYGQLRREQPSYAKWVQETMLEDAHTCDYRLSRLATWLMNQPDEETDETEIPIMTSHAKTKEPVNKENFQAKPKAIHPKSMINKSGKGYAKDGRKEWHSEAAASSSEGSAAVTTDQLKLMMETMATMKQEIQQLREGKEAEEPRRKKTGETEPSETEKSFQMVMDP
ncbi:GIP [Symbiodinium microadriaticum]|nr:GIP [Symbiodinium microadriaticum]